MHADILVKWFFDSDSTTARHHRRFWAAVPEQLIRKNPSLGLLAAGGFTSAIPSRGDDLTASLVKSPFRRCPLGRPAMIRWRSRRTGESGSGPTNGTDWAYAAAGRSAIRHRGGFPRMGNPNPRLHARQDQGVQTVCTKSAHSVIYHTDTPISAALTVCRHPDEPMAPKRRPGCCRR